MRPFLVLQLRPETEAADEEFGAFLDRGGLRAEEVHRIRLDQGPLPALSLDDYAGVIVGGGPGCVSDAPERKDPLEARIEAEVMGLMPEVLARDMPFMGCCYGMGILGATLGAPVGKTRYGEPIGGDPRRRQRLRHPVPSRGEGRELRQPHRDLQGSRLLRPLRGRGADRRLPGRDRDGPAAHPVAFRRAVPGCLGQACRRRHKGAALRPVGKEMPEM